jgi:uncharacterized protein (TIGR00270 family)
MQCDICGSKDATLKALIEGTEMSVCQGCAAYGKVVSKAVSKPLMKSHVEVVQKHVERGEIVQMLVSDYSNIVKSKREKMGINQEDAAKKLSIKESLLHKIETGAFEPNIELARKLEKFYSVHLVEEVKEESVHGVGKKEEEFTIGDFIKIKGK